MALQILAVETRGFHDNLIFTIDIYFPTNIKGVEFILKSN